MSSEEKPASSSGFLPRRHRTSIVLFCISTFFYWTSLYLYVPILPVYAQSIGASLSTVGIVVASYAAPQLLMRIPLGAWSDTLGRRKPLVIAALAVITAGALGLGLSPDPAFLTISRAVTGIGAGVWMLFIVYFTSFYENSNRAIGIMNFVQSGSVVFASLGGGYIAELRGFRDTFYIAAALGLFALFFMLPSREPQVREHKAFSWTEFAKVASSPYLIAVSGLGVLYHFTQFSTTFGFISVYGDSIGASRSELGIITMLSTLTSAFGALATPQIIERKGYTFTLLAASIFLGMTIIAIPFIKSVTLLEADQFLSGLAKGLMTTSLVAMSIRHAPSRQRATALGVYQASYAFGMLIGPLLSGILAESYGLSAIFYLCASLCAVIALVTFMPVLSRKAISNS